MRKVTGRCDLGSSISQKCKDEEEMCFSEWMEKNVIRELQNHKAWWNNQSEYGDEHAHSYADQYGYWNCDDDKYEKPVPKNEDTADEFPNDKAENVIRDSETGDNCAEFANSKASLEQAVSVWVQSLDSAVDFDDFMCVDSKSEGSGWFCDS